MLLKKNRSCIDTSDVSFVDTSDLTAKIALKVEFDKLGINKFVMF